MTDRWRAPGRGRGARRVPAGCGAWPPVRWRGPTNESSPQLVSNSANTPSMSRKHLPPAVLVSIGVGCRREFDRAYDVLKVQMLSMWVTSALVLPEEVQNDA